MYALRVLPRFPQCTRFYNPRALNTRTLRTEEAPGDSAFSYLRALAPFLPQRWAGTLSVSPKAPVGHLFYFPFFFITLSVLFNNYDYP